MSRRHLPLLAASALLFACSRPAEPAPPPLTTTTPHGDIALENQLARGALSRFGIAFPVHATVGRETPSSVEVVVPANVPRVEAFLSPALRPSEVERSGGKVVFVDATVAGDESGASYTVVLRPDGARTRVVVRRENIPTAAEVALLPEPTPDPKPTLQIGAPPPPLAAAGRIELSAPSGPPPEPPR